MGRYKAFEPEERLEKARDLFWEKGYNATSMQDLVDAMGLNRASIYDTYGDKHSLYIQCLSNYTMEAYRDYTKSCACFTSPLAAIENILRQAIDKTVGAGKSCMAVKSTFELGAVDATVQAIVKESSDHIIRTFETLLEKAKVAGEIKADKDVHLLASLIAANFSALWLNYILYEDPKMVGQLADFLMSVIRS